MMSNLTCYATVVAMAVGLPLNMGQAQTTLKVNAGQTLTGADLLAGEFQGQPFTLGPDLTIEINDGGQLNLMMGTADVSFAGATININEGGFFSQSMGVDFTDLTLNIFAGGYTHISDLKKDVAANVQGGILLSPNDINGGSTVAMSSGSMLLSASSSDSSGMVNMTGGVLLRSSSVSGGASLTISGGLIAENFSTSTGGQVIFVGDEFQLNGMDVVDLDAGLPENGVFTGTLADGSVFIFSNQAGDDDAFSGTVTSGSSVFILGNDISDRIAAGTVTLQSTAVSPVDTTPMTISAESELHGLRHGQNLTLVSGGTLGEHFAVVGATLNISGGTVGNDLQAAYSDVAISGGHIGDSDGSVNDFFAAYDGSNVTISGGRFGDRLQAYTGSTIDISGGGFDNSLCTWSGSSVTLHGDDFQLNGSDVADVDAGVTANDLFTGTLSDGTVIILSGRERKAIITDGMISLSTTIHTYDPIAANTTTLSTGSLGAIDTTPQSVASGVGPRGLRPGQTLTLSGTGQLGDNFGLVNAILNIDGGTVGDYLRVAHGNIQMSDGLVDGRVLVYDGGMFTMTGGEVTREVNANYGSHVVILDGTVGKVYANEGGDIQIDGGLSDSITVEVGGSLEMTGGQVASSISTQGGHVTLSGGTLGMGLYVSSLNDVPGYAQVTGGQIDTLRVEDDSTVDFADGVVDLVAVATGSSQLNITGGQFSSIRAESVATINIYGGEVTDRIRTQLGGTINVWGGDILGKFNMVTRGTVNLFVQQLLLNGVPVDLTLDETYIITERDGMLLNAILADGSAIDITLNGTSVIGQDYFYPQTTLTATLVPEPASIGLIATGIGVLCFRRRGTR